MDSAGNTNEKPAERENIMNDRHPGRNAGGTPEDAHDDPDLKLDCGDLAVEGSAQEPAAEGSAPGSAFSDSSDEDDPADAAGTNGEDRGGDEDAVSDGSSEYDELNTEIAGIPLQGSEGVFEGFDGSYVHLHDYSDELPAHPQTVTDNRGVGDSPKPSPDGPEFSPRTKKRVRDETARGYHYNVRPKGLPALRKYMKLDKDDPFYRPDWYGQGRDAEKIQEARELTVKLKDRSVPRMPSPHSPRRKAVKDLFDEMAATMGPVLMKALEEDSADSDSESTKGPEEESGNANEEEEDDEILPRVSLVSPLSDAANEVPKMTTPFVKDTSTQQSTADALRNAIRISEEANGTLQTTDVICMDDIAAKMAWEDVSQPSKTKWADDEDDEDFRRQLEDTSRRNSGGDVEAESTSPQTSADSVDDSHARMAGSEEGDNIAKGETSGENETTKQARAAETPTEGQDENKEPARQEPETETAQEAQSTESSQATQPTQAAEASVQSYPAHATRHVATAPKKGIGASIWADPEPESSGETVTLPRTTANNSGTSASITADDSPKPTLKDSSPTPAAPELAPALAKKTGMDASIWADDTYEPTAAKSASIPPAPAPEPVFPAPAAPGVPRTEATVASTPMPAPAASEVSSTEAGSTPTPTPAPGPPKVSPTGAALPSVSTPVSAPVPTSPATSIVIRIPETGPALVPRPSSLSAPALASTSAPAPTHTPAHTPLPVVVQLPRIVSAQLYEPSPWSATAPTPAPVPAVASSPSPLPVVVRLPQTGSAPLAEHSPLSATAPEFQPAASSQLTTATTSDADLMPGPVSNDEEEPVSTSKDGSDHEPASAVSGESPSAEETSSTLRDSSSPTHTTGLNVNLSPQLKALREKKPKDDPDSLGAATMWMQDSYKNRHEAEQAWKRQQSYRKQRDESRARQVVLDQAVAERDRQLEKVKGETTEEIEYWRQQCQESTKELEGAKDRVAELEKELSEKCNGCVKKKLETTMGNIEDQFGPEPKRGRCRNPRCAAIRTKLEEEMTKIDSLEGDKIRLEEKVADLEEQLHASHETWAKAWDDRNKQWQSYQEDIETTAERKYESTDEETEREPIPWLIELGTDEERTQFVKDLTSWIIARNQLQNIGAPSYPSITSATVDELLNAEDLTLESFTQALRDLGFPFDMEHLATAIEDIYLQNPGLDTPPAILYASQAMSHDLHAALVALLQKMHNWHRCETDDVRQIMQLRREIEELQEKIKTEESSGDRKPMDEDAAGNQEYVEQIDQLMKDFDNLQSELDDCRKHRETADASNEDNEKLKKELKDLKNQLNQCRQGLAKVAVSNVKTELSKKNKHEGLTEELKQCLQHRKTVERDLELLREEKEGIEAAFARARELLDAYEREIKPDSEYDFENDLDVDSLSKEDLKAKLVDCRKKAQKLDARIVNCHDMRIRAEEKCTALSNEITQLKEKNHVLEMMSTSSSNLQQQWDHDAEERAARYTELEQKHTELMRKLEELEDKCNDDENRENDCLREKEQLQQQIQDLKTELKTTQDDLQALKDDTKNRSASIDDESLPGSQTPTPSGLGIEMLSNVPEIQETPARIPSSPKTPPSQALSAHGSPFDEFVTPPTHLQRAYATSFAPKSPLNRPPNTPKTASTRDAFYHFLGPRAEGSKEREKNWKRSQSYQTTLQRLNERARRRDNEEDSYAETRRQAYKAMTGNSSWPKISREDRENDYARIAGSKHRFRAEVAVVG